MFYLALPRLASPCLERFLAGPRIANDFRRARPPDRARQVNATVHRRTSYSPKGCPRAISDLHRLHDCKLILFLSICGWALHVIDPWTAKGRRLPAWSRMLLTSRRAQSSRRASDGESAGLLPARPPCPPAHPPASLHIPGCRASQLPRMPRLPRLPQLPRLPRPPREATAGRAIPFPAETAQENRPDGYCGLRWPEVAQTARFQKVLQHTLDRNSLRLPVMLVQFDA